MYLCPQKDKKASTSERPQKYFVLYLILQTGFWVPQGEKKTKNKAEFYQNPALFLTLSILL